jgi:hypothetical protein
MIPDQIPPTDIAVARSATRARQILMDPIPGNSIFPPNINHDDVLKIIQAAISTALKPKSNKEYIKALLQLRNGGIITELDSEETVTQLRHPTARKAFLQALNFSVTLKDQTYTLVAQYVPVNLLIERPGLLRLIEGKNHLEDDLLASMRWIKPPHKRSPTQTMAFATIQVNDANTANKLIKDGLYIDHHLIHIKKDLKEPIQCVKCQRHGHIARNCNISRDICGTCTDNHRTTDCNAYQNPPMRQLPQ